MKKGIHCLLLCCIAVFAKAQTDQYAFFGHCYQWHSNGGQIDYRVVALDKSPYERIWIGGDLCSEALLRRSHLYHIDSVMQIGRPQTQYALGNHDVRNGNLEWYREFTGREPYNVYSENGAVSVCINTQLNVSDCYHLNAQFQLISDVCDTISESSHLFLFGHSNLWYDVPGLPGPYKYAHTNFRYWMTNCDSANARFINTIYPKLQEVRERGIQVYCILGDSGDPGPNLKGTKGFHQLNPDSIHFFASGINNSKYTDPAQLDTMPKDKILIFEHNIPSQSMKWSFQDLDSLIASPASPGKAP